MILKKNYELSTNYHMEDFDVVPDAPTATYKVDYAVSYIKLKYAKFNRMIQ